MKVQHPRKIFDRFMLQKSQEHSGKENYFVDFWDGELKVGGRNKAEFHGSLRRQSEEKQFCLIDFIVIHGISLHSDFPEVNNVTL